jgi:hypothetical protein
MWFFIIFIIGFVSLCAYACWHYCIVVPKAEKIRQEELKMKAHQSWQAARPLKDYVANIQPGKKSFIPFRLPFLGSSNPSLTNIRRFTALTLGSGDEVFYVRDDEGVIYGPAEHSAILTWITENRITGGTMLSNHEAGPWLPAKQIKVFKMVFEQSVSTSVKKRFENIQIK